MVYKRKEEECMYLVRFSMPRTSETLTLTRSESGSSSLNSALLSKGGDAIIVFFIKRVLEARAKKSK